MAKFTVRLDNATVLERIQELVDRLLDASPAMREVAGVLVFSAEESFEREVSPDGTPWEQLAAGTIEERTKLGNWPGRKLQRSGRLVTSITTDSGPDFAAVGSNLDYAAIHNFGGNAGRNRRVAIPQREFLGLNQDGEDEVLDIVEAHLSAA